MVDSHGAAFEPRPQKTPCRVAPRQYSAARIAGASRAMRASGGWDVEAGVPGRVRVAAALSVLLWIGVIACGRLLAYT